MVATSSLEKELGKRGFSGLTRWSRGVDTSLFRPRDKEFLRDPRPIFMYAGRVAIEKNIEAFLRLDLPGTKYVVGDGPQRESLRQQYPEVRFPGYRQGVELSRYMAAADAFVFPSRTDTFGLVLLEALACGVPVAAYPVAGPIDVIQDPEVGTLDQNLRRAALNCVSLDPGNCRKYAIRHSWEYSARQFTNNLTMITTPSIFW
jgi:glycosyltransferase involved in cell wall biosynthesis